MCKCSVCIVCMCICCCAFRGISYIYICDVLCGVAHVVAWWQGNELQCVCWLYMFTVHVYYTCWNLHVPYTYMYRHATMCMFPIHIGMCICTIHIYVCIFIICLGDQIRSGIAYIYRTHMVYMYILSPSSWHVYVYSIYVVYRNMVYINAVYICDMYLHCRL